MTHETRKIAAFIGVLWIAAAAVFVRSLPLAPSADWLDFAVFCVLAALSEKWYVATSKESGMSLSFTVHFAGRGAVRPGLRDHGRASAAS